MGLFNGVAANDPRGRAWLDQFEAEFREQARVVFACDPCFGGLLEQLGQDALDHLLELGGIAFALVAIRRGALKRAEF